VIFRYSWSSHHKSSVVSSYKPVLDQERSRLPAFRSVDLVISVPGAVRNGIGPALAVSCGIGWALFRAVDLGGCGGISLLLLADNYNRTTNDLTTEAQSAQRTHRDDHLTMVLDHSPAWQFLRAIGSSARQPIARATWLEGSRFASSSAACGQLSGAAAPLARAGRLA
jgi:hypothetical protein